MKKTFLFVGLATAISFICCSALFAADATTIPRAAPEKSPAIESPPSLCYGACCFDDGHCEWLDPTQCQNSGGTFMGENVPCHPNPCPQPACCEMWVERGGRFSLHFDEPGAELSVCWCCPEEGQPVFTYLPGCNYGVDGCDETGDANYGNLQWTEAVFVPSDTCGAYGGHWTTTFSIAGSPPQDIGCICVFFEYQLPVELTAEPILSTGDCQLTLSFTVADEHDVSKYEIIRNGAKIAELGLADGSYTYRDANLVNGRRYEYSIVAVELGERNVLSYNGESVWAGVPSSEPTTITDYVLHQCYPNPFNPTTTITFDLVENGFVNLKVYNLVGQEVAQIVDRMMDVGRYTVTFDGSNLPSGVYVYRLEVNDFSSTRKMMLMK